jgi:folate-binding protein YgfZ
MRETWERSGAVIASETGRPQHFGDPAAELRAALESCALVDRSDLARLVATGPDFLGLLHRLSTGDVASLVEGQGKPTVLTTPKGRIVERLFVHQLGKAGVLAVGGRGSGERITDHLARFTFAEQTGLEETTERTFQFALIGPSAGTSLKGIELPERFQSRQVSVADVAVQALGEDGLSGDGFSFTGDAGDAAAVWQALSTLVEQAGGRPAGDEPLEAWRVLRGLPASGHELTEEYNPLEAGLSEAVSFDKGCYVGQEVVARLRTYDKVSRTLVGLKLPEGSALPPSGAGLYDEGQRVGTLTSVAVPADRRAPVALAYLKTRVLRPELELHVGEGADLTARPVKIPFSIETREGS